MMRITQLIAVLVALTLVVGSVPAAAMASTAQTISTLLYQVQNSTNTTPVQNSTNTTTPVQNSTNNTTGSEQLRASTGQQLSTVLTITDDEVTTAIEESSAEAAFASAAESERADLLASRASTLRDRSDELVNERQTATAAYEAGNLSASEYAQRVAVLSGQASTVSVVFSELDQRAESVPTAELQATSYNTDANAAAQSQLQSLTGSSSQALLKQYTGLTTGEFNVDRTDGVAIEVEGDDGEQSRELERDQPGDGSFVISQREAVAAAEEMLSANRGSGWTLQSVERDSDGYFELEFGFNSPTHTGDAEVSVDGQTGDIFEFEEELEPRDSEEEDEGEEDDNEEEDDEGDDNEEEDESEDDKQDDESGDNKNDNEEEGKSNELSVGVVAGEPTPNATVTIEVTQNGGSVADAAVTMNDERVGQTDENGQLTITLPNSEEVEIDVKAGDSEGELEFEFETDDDEADDQDEDDGDDDEEDEQEDEDEDEDDEDNE